MRRFYLAALLIALAGCGEAIEDDHFAGDVEREIAAPAAVRTEAVAVRIGELGASFDACGSIGTTRQIREGAAMTVKAAPFDTAADSGRIAAGARFFICTRSHDQRWMGVVYDDSGTPDDRCGVSSPVASRRGYDGACRSGWVPSAFVRLVAA